MSLIEYEVKEKIGLITLNRPEKMNALNNEMLRELIDAMEDVRVNPDVWIGIITGNGKAFSAGRDLGKDTQESTDPRAPSTDDVYKLSLRIYKPMISAINGICLAQGCGLALSTDIQIASEKAQFGWPQVKRGISSISGPTMLAHKIPLNKCFEYLFTGEFINAQEALKLGLINKVVPHEELMSETMAFAKKILENAPLAIRAMKEATLLTANMGKNEAFEVASKILAGVKKTEDAKEGLRAFAEKRKPVWVGR